MREVALFPWRNEDGGGEEEGERFVRPSAAHLELEGEAAGGDEDGVDALVAVARPPVVLHPQLLDPLLLQTATKALPDPYQAAKEEETHMQPRRRLGRFRVDSGCFRVDSGSVNDIFRVDTAKRSTTEITVYHCAALRKSLLTN